MSASNAHPARSLGLSLVARRNIRAGAQRLFDAWTQPEQLMRWWGPAPVTCVSAEIDLRVGGRYRIGNRFPDGRVLWIVGEFERIAAPSELVYSWRLEGGPSGEERVTVRFEPFGEFTQVTVLHERIATAALRDEHALGWDGCLQRLVYLAG